MFFETPAASSWSAKSFWKPDLPAPSGEMKSVRQSARENKRVKSDTDGELLQGAAKWVTASGS